MRLTFVQMAKISANLERNRKSKIEVANGPKPNRKHKELKLHVTQQREGRRGARRGKGMPPPPRFSMPNFMPTTNAHFRNIRHTPAEKERKQGKGADTDFSEGFYPWQSTVANFGSMVFTKLGKIRGPRLRELETRLQKDAHNVRIALEPI